MVNIAKFVLFAVLIVPVSTSTFADQFSMVCNFSSKNCGSEVVDLVSSRFTSRYPSDKWQIVVLAEFTPYSNGGGVGYAIAGVSRKPLPPQSANQAFVPRNRFVNTSRRIGRHISPAETTEETILLVREALEQMMVACDNTQNCNIE
jgi:hypothetical protein